MRIGPLVLVVALFSAVPGVASAQSDAAAAEALWQEGKALLEEGRFSEACIKLSESYRLDPGTGALLALAHCHEQEGKLASAWAEYQEAAGRSKKEGNAERERVSRERAKLLEPRLSRLSIEVDPATLALSGLKVERSGASVGRGSYGVAIPVDGGDYRVVATADGRKPWETVVVVRPEADQVTVRVPELEVAPSEPAAASGHTTSPSAVALGAEPSGWSPLRVGGAATAGIGLVSLGVSGFFALRAQSKKSESDDAGCSDNMCPPAAAELRRSALSAADVATVTSIAGVVLVATGATLFVVGGSKGKSQGAEVSAALAPGAGIVAVSGVF
jgi:hypothetical protein